MYFHVYYHFMQFTNKYTPKLTPVCVPKILQVHVLEWYRKSISIYLYIKVSCSCFYEFLRICKNYFESHLKISQRTTKPTRRLVQPAKIQISLHIRKFDHSFHWSHVPSTASRLIQREINENPCHIGWMYRLIRVLAGHIGLIVVL